MTHLFVLKELPCIILTEFEHRLYRIEPLVNPTLIVPQFFQAETVTAA